MGDEGDFIWKDGKRYVRVSAVINDLSNLKMAKNEHVERKILIGNEVHEAIADYLQGKFPFLSGPSLAYFKSFLHLKDILNFTVVHHSTRYFDDNLMLTGEPDNVLAIASEPLPLIVDWKCTAQKSPTWIYQAHAYKYLLNGYGIKTADRFLFVKLNPKGGNPKVENFNYDKNIETHVKQKTKEFWEKQRELENIAC